MGAVDNPDSDSIRILTVIDAYKKLGLGMHFCASAFENVAVGPQPRLSGIAKGDCHLETDAKGAFGVEDVFCFASAESGISAKRGALDCATELEERSERIFP